MSDIKKCRVVLMAVLKSTAWNVTRQTDTTYVNRVIMHDVNGEEHDIEGHTVEVPNACKTKWSQAGIERAEWYSKVTGFPMEFCEGVQRIEVDKKYLGDPRKVKNA